MYNTLISIIMYNSCDKATSTRDSEITDFTVSSASIACPGLPGLSTTCGALSEACPSWSTHLNILHIDNDQCIDSYENVDQVMLTEDTDEDTNNTLEKQYSMFDSFTENDIRDFEDELHIIIENVLESEIIHISKPNYMTILIQKIIDNFYHDWILAEICTEYDYPEIFDYIEDFLTQFLETMEHEIPPRQHINNIPDSLSQLQIEIYSRKISELQSRYQPVQRTTEWHNFRHNLITASNIYKAFGSDSQVNSLIYEKCKPFVPYKMNYLSQNSRQWGTTYEPISILIYENIYNTQIADFGCIQHSKYSCIGASPDGININTSSNRFGRMIEVKNIVNREITDFPKEEYWIQMQIQMETCDLDECDFIETRFKEFNNEEEFYTFNPSDVHQYKGVYLCFIYQENLETTSINTTVSSASIACSGHSNPRLPCLNTTCGALIEACTSWSTNDDIKTIQFDTECTDHPPKWIYMPLNIPLDITNINNWIQQQRINQRPNYVLYSTHYWYLDQFSCIFVKRNRLWFQSVLPKILDVWNTIEKERETGYEHRATKSRTSIQKPIFLGVNHTI